MMLNKYLQERKTIIDMISEELTRLHKNGYSLESVTTCPKMAMPEEGNNNPKDLVKIELVFKDVREDEN